MRIEAQAASDMSFSNSSRSRSVNTERNRTSPHQVLRDFAPLTLLHAREHPGEAPGAIAGEPSGSSEAESERASLERATLIGIDLLLVFAAAACLLLIPFLFVEEVLS